MVESERKKRSLASWGVLTSTEQAWRAGQESHPAPHPSQRVTTATSSVEVGDESRSAHSAPVGPREGRLAQRRGEEWGGTDTWSIIAHLIKGEGQGCWTITSQGDSISDLPGEGKPCQQARDGQVGEQLGMVS